MNWLRDTLNNKGARAKCLKWAYFALATSLHVLANVSKYRYLFCQKFVDACVIPLHSILSPCYLFVFLFKDPVIAENVTFCYNVGL